MSIDVIGAGFGRTGTMSLKAALERLGYDRCYHMIEVVNQETGRNDGPAWLNAHRGQPVDWDQLFQGYRATVDWPSCNLWRELGAHWPDALIILTERDPQQWYRSVMNTIYPSSRSMKDHPEEGDRWTWACELIWDRIFDGRMDDEQHVIDCYLQHNQAVKDEVPPERLLVYQPSDGWEPLCQFLGVPVPDEPYPHTNSTADFQERVKQRQADKS